jgi:hypothetical protein
MRALTEVRRHLVVPTRAGSVSYKGSRHQAHSISQPHGAVSFSWFVVLVRTSMNVSYGTDFHGSNSGLSVLRTLQCRCPSLAGAKVVQPNS